LRRSETIPYKRLCIDCADDLGLAPSCVRAEVLKQASPQASPRSASAKAPNSPPLVVHNTFVTFPRSDSAECHFNPPTGTV
jgi:hypothetical protein